MKMTLPNASSIAVIGLAISHAERFTKLLKPHGIHVAYVWDEDARAAVAFAKRHGATPLSAPDCLPWEQLSGAVITTRTVDHLVAAVPFLERGLPVFLDKQLALGWDEALALRAAAARGGAPFLSGSIRRYAPAYQSIARHLRESTDEEIISVHLYEPHGIKPGHWQDDPRQSGGFLVNIGIHTADPLFALPMGEIADVYATTGRLLHRDVLSEDFATILVRYHNGAVAVMELLGAQAPIVATQPTLRVHTRRTTLHATLPEGTAAFHAGPPLYDADTYSRLNGSEHAAKALAALFLERKASVPIKEQLAVFKLLLLARRSALERCPVSWETLPEL